MSRRILSVLRRATGCALIALVASASAKVWDVDEYMGSAPGLGKAGRSTSAAAVQDILSRLAPGDALRLSRELPLGRVTVGDVSPDVEVFGGFGGELRVEGRMRGWRFVYACHGTDFIVQKSADLEGCRFFCSFSGRRFIDASPSSYEAIAPGFAPRLAKAAVDSKEGAHGIKWGVGQYDFDNYGNTVMWMPAYYVDGSGARNETETPQVRINDATDGGKWLFAIEAEQAAHCPAVRIQNSDRLQLYSGSTEGDNYETGAVYYIENSREVVLGMRRFFSNHKGSGWSGTPLLSLSVTGEGNIIHNLIDIANPASVSLRSTDPSLQIWQSFFEDEIRIESGTFQFMVTPQGMIDQVNTWTEPVQVGQEVVLSRDGEDLLEATNPAIPTPPAYDFQPWMSKKPRNLAKTAGRQRVTRRFREARTFGAALLAAGADPSGRTRSDAAFEKVLASDNLVEVPAGRFRLGKSLAAIALAARGGTATVALLGAGPERTTLVADRSVEYVVDLSAPLTGLGRTGTPATATAVLDGIRISGGRNGVLIGDGVSTIMSDFAVEGVAKACIVNSAHQITVPVEGQSCGSDANCSDMHLYENGSLNGGEYGIYYTEFADKQGIRNISFSDHSKAGIYAANTNLFHGWIGDCDFSNIDGPGIDLSGGHVLPPAYGSAYYTQWVTMIEGCTFTECGSSTRAAVDYGYTDINMLCNSSITTTGKSIKYGFLGSAAAISNVTIDVNAPVALALRNCRATEGSRTPASILHTVDTKGGQMLMVEGYPQGDGGPSSNPADDYAYTTRMASGWDGWDIHGGPKWWKDGYQWAHTVLFYDCNIGGETMGYVLKNGEGFEKDLVTGATYLPRAQIPTNTAAAAGDVWVYDMFGRRIKRMPARNAVGVSRADRALPRGLYFTRRPDGRTTKLSTF